MRISSYFHNIYTQSCIVVIKCIFILVSIVLIKLFHSFIRLICEIRHENYNLNYSYFYVSNTYTSFFTTHVYIITVSHVKINRNDLIFIWNEIFFGMFTLYSLKKLGKLVRGIFKKVELEAPAHVFYSWLIPFKEL